MPMVSMAMSFELIVYCLRIKNTRDISKSVAWVLGPGSQVKRAVYVAVANTNYAQQKTAMAIQTQTRMI